MKIHLNGEEQDLAVGMTLAALLESLQLPVGRVAVERNRAVVSRATYSETILEEGDRLEIVRFVGGG